MTNDEHVPSWRPLSPPEEAGASDGTLPAYVANALIGLRVRGWWPGALRKGWGSAEPPCSNGGERGPVV